MSKPAAPVTAIGNGVFRVERADGGQQIAYGIADGATTWVFMDGETYVLVPSRTRRLAGTHDAAALAAPMPATVTHVHVTVGQDVARGDPLVTLEAMKLELPIRAVSDGTITAVNCRAGELVQAGVPLIEMSDAGPEPEPEHEPGTGTPGA